MSMRRKKLKWNGQKFVMTTIEDKNDDNNGKDDEELPTLEKLLHIFGENVDLKHIRLYDEKLHFLFFTTLIDSKKFHDDLLNPLGILSYEEAVIWIKRKDIKRLTSVKKATNAITMGSVVIFIENEAFSVPLFGPDKGGIERSETEGVIIGAHDAFVEDAETNLSLIRRRIKSPKLKIISLKVGEISKNDVFLLYIEDIASKEIVEELKKRILSIEVDTVNDADMLAQLIDENPDSVFPQYFNTELPDVVRSKLVAGKVALILEGSPVALTAPASFFEFIQSPDDYNQRWAIGTSLRILRILAIFITVTFTSFYVAFITYHYEVLPEDLLLTLAESRTKVPFPPVIEAVLMELTIELLREAGARLPTKIGQTIGVVGGIVIGQAAVEAGFTSNILIIAVAISAISSFVLPSYNMSNAVRIIRFGLIVLAGMLGLFGIMIGLALTLIHVVSLTSLNTPYFVPVSPLYVKEWRDVFVRGPYWAMKRRPVQTNTRNRVRQHMKK